MGLAVRCPLVHFVISFSETRAMFWKGHVVLKDNNLKWLSWLVPLFPYSCLCCFSNDWFCNHWVLLDKWKVFWQCLLCSEIWCASNTLNEFIYFSLIFHRTYTLAYSEAKMLISKFTLLLWFTISTFEKFSFLRKGIILFSLILNSKRIFINCTLL